MNSANYGIYGSAVYYAALSLTASVSLVLVVFMQFPQPVFIATLVVSLSILLLSHITLSYLGEGELR